MRTVLVDDEAPARRLLAEYLAAHADVQVVAECVNGFEAVKVIGELAPDLVFLDVQMPKLDGFEVLELLDPGPAVVFSTAYDEYALKAFEVHAVDYLLKPYSRERLAEALDRVRERMTLRVSGEPSPAAAVSGSGRTAPSAGPAAGTATRKSGPANVAAEDDDDIPPPSGTARLAASARGPGHFVERLLVKDGANVQVIPVETVDYLEAQDDYVEIHAGGKSWLKTQPLSDLAEGLDPGRFVRVHRSFVVQIDRIARLELYAKDSRVAQLRDGREIPVSRSGYARLKELM
ncbi:MAG: response regulator [Candidatus Eisenbacteria bacterium]